MEGNINFYNDRELIRNLPEQLYNELMQHQLISEDDQKVAFAGVVIGISGINVFFPRSTPLIEMKHVDKLSAASALMAAIDLYTTGGYKVDHSHDGGVGERGVINFRLIRYILSDYISNGLYTHRREQIVRNSGKTNWKKTISRSMSFPSPDGDPVYLDLYGTKKRQESDCEISRIQARILRQLDEKYSWLLTGTENAFSVELRDIPEPVFSSIDYQVAILERELRDLYADREIRLIGSLIEYLRESGGIDRSSNVIGVRKFHHVWEHMLSKVLPNKVDINKRLPKPSYKLASGQFEDAFSKGQRTDIVLENQADKVICVIDAKYYGGQTVQQMPGWHDLVKQFFYSKAVEEVYGSAYQFKNAFIFPGADGPYKSAHMKDESGKVLDSDYIPIHCMYVCTLDVVQAYINGSFLHKKATELLARVG